MSFPETSDALKSAGYKFLSYSTCKECGEPIEWYESPRVRKIPMNPMERGSSKAEMHFNTCSDAPLLRGQNGK